LAIKEGRKVLEFVRWIKVGGRAGIDIEHNNHHVMEVCDRLVVLERGVIVLDVPASSMSHLELTDFLVSLR